MAKKSAQDFINKFKGLAIDDDGVYNVQCVDGFRVFNKYMGYPALPTGTGWADGYWYYREKQYKRYYDFITSNKDLKFGDWCFWALASSCPSSHVGMFVGYANAQKTKGYIFGQNQGNKREFRTVVIDLDILGAFRAKDFTVSESDAKAYVEKLYKAILKRKADSGGLKAWTSALVQGQEPKNVVKGFFESKEYLKKNTNNEQFVIDCYAGYLFRTASKKEIKYWTDSMKKGKLRKNVMNGFADSKEYKKLLEKVGF